MRKRIERAPRDEWRTRVHVLMGHAAYLYTMGQHDMPAWFYDLAEKLALAHLDTATVERVRQVAEQMRAKHAPSTETTRGVKEDGVWSTGICDRGVFLESSDFHHDARLYVDGDFQGAEKLTYAAEIATRLNAWQVVSRTLAASKTASPADAAVPTHALDPEDPRCVDGAPACQDCLCRGGCLKASPSEPENKAP